MEYVPPSSFEPIGMFCGRKEPFAISVKELGFNRSLAVAFISDGGIEETGFNATYYVLNDTSEIGECCGCIYAFTGRLDN